jgi:hypothetical protein
MGGHLLQDHRHPIPNSTWRLTLVVEVSTEDVDEEEEIGLQKEGVEEGHIWMTGAIATHEVGLKRVDGVETVMKETVWIVWIVMLTQRPDTTSETNAETLEIANCSEIKWKLAPTRATIQDSLVRKYRRRLLLLHLLPPLDLRLAED